MKKTTSKRNVTYLALVLLITTLSCGAMRYQIKSINTPTININNQQMRTGDWFNDNAVIRWKNDNQAIQVLSENKKIYIISGKRYKAAKAKKFSDYITSVKDLGTRGNEILLSKEINEDLKNYKEGSFLMLDNTTIQFDSIDVPQDVRFILIHDNDKEIIPTTRIENGFIVAREAIEPYYSIYGPNLSFTLYLSEGEEKGFEPVTDFFELEVLPYELE